VEQVDDDELRSMLAEVEKTLVKEATSRSRAELKSIKRLALRGLDQLGTVRMDKLPPRNKLKYRQQCADLMIALVLSTEATRNCCLQPAVEKYGRRPTPEESVRELRKFFSFAFRKKLKPEGE